jgi:hypothetical protein
LAAHFDMLRREREYRPIDWRAPPLPDFFWANADGLKRPWRPDGVPSLGEVWFGPLRIRRGTEAAVRAQVAMVQADVLDTVRPVLPFLRQNILALRLPERLRA